MEEIYKLEAIIDLTNGKNEIRVKPVADSAWGNLAFYLEVVGFLCQKSLWNAKALKTPETPEALAEYVRDYVLKACKDYRDVTGN